MNLKVLAVLTIIAFLIICILAFIFNIPVAYVPNNASNTEFITYHIIFVSVEVFILTSLFMNMIKNSDLEISDILLFFKK